MAKLGMKIQYDAGSMGEERSRKMEVDLQKVLIRHGWTGWASGTDLDTEFPVRNRDLSFRFCAYEHCEHWAQLEGCRAPQVRCVQEV